MCFESLIREANLIVKNYGDFNKFYHILENFNLDTAQFRKFKKTNKIIIENNKNEYGYSKIKIFENNIYDIYVIFWIGKTNVPFHDHSKNGCYFKVLNGVIEEVIKKTNNEEKTRILHENDIGYMHNDIGIHKVNNIKEHILDHRDIVEDYLDASVSVHVYSPTNYICKKFF